MNQSTTQPEVRDPKTLHVRPCVNVLPMLADDDPQFLKLLASVRADGVRDEITLDQDGNIVDGRHRVKAARAENKDTVPIVQKHFANDREALDFAVARLFDRRHYTGSARAYTTAKLEGAHKRLPGRPTLKNVRDFSEKIMSENSDIISEKGKSRDRMSALHGFSKDRWDQAIYVLKRFEEHPEVVAEYEPLILSGEKSLWNIMAYVDGRFAENNTGRVDARANIEENFYQWVDAGVHRWTKFWPKLRSASARAEVIEAVTTKLVEAFPDDVAKRLEKKLRERREAGR
ncbi:MAG: hypothetical protein HZA88_16525 [Verrucomicrobia bacterium]|nr:hypothetical protein [Verrucomicrobiota bacterium]